MRTLAVLIVLLVAGCASCPAPIPTVPKIVRVPVEVFKPIPEWATKAIPEDAPRNKSTEEAVRLANARLETIKAENCRKRLLAKLDKGEAVNAKDCGP